MLDPFVYSKLPQALEDLASFSKMNRNTDQPLYLKIQVPGYTIEKALERDTDPAGIIAIALNGKVFSSTV